MGPEFGDQGWYNPNTGEYNPFDHTMYFQYNIVDIPDPFIQKGTATDPIVYWLDIQVDVPYIGPPLGGTWGDIDPFQPEWGWKTTFKTPPGLEDQAPGAWNDDAVWSDSGGTVDPWSELRDPDFNSPEYGHSLDMAFVITPEPATLLVLALGLVPAFLGRARRK